MPDLATAKQQASAQAVAFANSVRENIARSVHYLQSARWPSQVEAARHIIGGTPSADELAMLEREARLRGKGETAEQLAHKVLANSRVFSEVGAAVDGIERATLDAIAAYDGSPDDIAGVLAAAKQNALAEFLDIMTAAYGPAQAQAMAAQFFGGAS